MAARYARGGSVLAVALGLGLSAACGGPDTSENVRQALEQANIDQVEVQVDDRANIVHLKGAVDSLAERTRAEEVASAAVGTTGRVLNELTVVGLNDETADDLDDEIVDTLDRSLDADPVLRERDVDFEVNNGVVTIKGRVRSADEKTRVGQIVQAAPGVKDVANALEIRREP